MVRELWRLARRAVELSTQAPIVREELKADLYGAAVAPGLVEGVARVIMSADKLAS